MSPVPEPLADTLRRLHREATDDCLCGLPTCKRCLGQSTARLTLRHALPALADIVAAVEGELGLGPALPGKPLSDSLAALREQIGAR